MNELGLTVKKKDDMVEWYSQIVLKSELADLAPVRGCMVIRPDGYELWQAITDYFNGRLKAMGIRNAYFPIFIPESFFRRESKHVEGFEPEVAWVANKDEEKGERLALRPTSETIMYDSYSRWIRSWRDLPLRINQWCNIIRWEVKDVKLFLRSREFLWQEGHCVYETEEECDRETIMIIKEYQRLSEEILAIPVLMGTKTEKEKFAGAKYTTTIEGFMPDGKALQMGTSHNLGQSFAKAFGIEYIGKDEKKHTPWQNSWGFSTRLLGAVVMVHGDDKGLVLPPRLAPHKLVIIPILTKKDRDAVVKAAQKLGADLSQFNPLFDEREEYSPGWKFNHWELKGIPLRLELGPKDLAAKQVVLVRRDTGEKLAVKLSEVKKSIKKLLESMHADMLAKARKTMEDSTFETADWDAFMDLIQSRKLVKTYFCGESECEDWIKDKTGGATSRCTPLGSKPPKSKKCVHCGKDAKVEIYFSKNY